MHSANRQSLNALIIALNHQINEEVLLESFWSHFICALLNHLFHYQQRWKQGRLCSNEGDYAIPAIDGCRQKTHDGIQATQC